MVACGVFILIGRVVLTDMGKSPNILWIVADCLRYDALSATEYHRPTTEPIDDYIETDFISFSDAATQSGFTLTVLSSLITGDYPSTHGVLRWDNQFPENVFTYRDAADSADLPPVEAIPGMNFISEEWNLTGAFDNVHSLSEEKSRRDCNQATADEICETALDRIDEEDEFNLLLWFFDLHDPWLSKPEFEGDNPKRDQYDTELQFLSIQLNKLFIELENRGLYDDTLIIFTGDHGDVFSEYRRLPWSTTGAIAEKIPGLKKAIRGDGYLGHLGRPLFDEIVHVPLFIKLPDNENGGQTTPGQVELIDILPTILDVADEDVGFSTDGKSILPMIRGTDDGKNYVRAILEANPANGRFSMVRSDKFKFIQHYNPRFNQLRENPLLYTARRFITPREVLLRRENERENIIQSNPMMAKKMRKHVSPLETKRRSNGVGDAKRKELEDLGYL